MLPDSVKKFVDVFSQLPSIGPRQATRLAFYLMGLGKNTIGGLAETINNLKNIKTCPKCFFMHENNNPLCYVCDNPQRQKNIIMVIEKETDLISIEKTRKYGGVYMVVGEIKKGGILEAGQKLKIKNLKSRVAKDFGKAEEIILAMNHTTYGDLNFLFLAEEFKICAKKITRLGRGLPTGGEIEFADEETLSEALRRRS